jgi:hypothetical protein
MEEFKDLEDLYQQIKDQINNWTYEEIELPVQFKSQVSIISDKNIKFHKFSAFASKTNGDSIIIPNQWFYLSKIMLPFNEELHKYYDKTVSLFSLDKLEALKKKGTLTKQDEATIDAQISNKKDADKIKRFVTDYKWWHGAKSLGRVQKDYFVSAILSLSGLINDSSSFLADICDFLRQNPHLSDLLIEYYNKQENELPFNRQQIFYGAPGTGKSHEIKRITKGQKVIRTTFHPDSDYSTFVGAYKPTMENSEVRVVPVVVNNGISLDQSNGTYWEKKIVYKFVKQAFLKAYLAAWKKMADAIITTNANTFTVGGNTFTLTAIDEDKVTYSSSFSLTKKGVQNVWNKLWSNSSFMIPTGQQSGESSEQAVCKWIYENTENCTKGSFDAGWDKLKNELATHSIDVDTGKGKADSKPKQIYTISLGDNDDTIQVTTNGNQKDKTRIKDCYSGESKPVGVEVGLVNILKELDPDSFENAWEKIKNKTNGTIAKVEPQFLIIEEINRGNCAQIFGDIFQLLDRQDNGFSTYPIEVDADIQQAIKTAFEKEDKYKLNGSINVEGAVEDYTSNHGKTLSEDLQEGRILLLPPNLYIWATMNTSDQSLFPIDSAFKRRWEWKYVPIDTKKEEWHILVNKHKYSWTSFLDIINDTVLTDETAEDKYLGFYFCKAENDIISAEQFVGKVLFYLWNDVFKVYGVPSQITNGSKEMTYAKFYNPDGSINEDRVEKLLDNLNVDNDKKNEAEASSETESNA